MRQGDTLTHILARQGIAATERQAVLEALGDLFDPAGLKAGDKIRLALDRQNHRKIVRTIALATGKTDDLTVDVEPGQGAQATSLEQPAASRTALPSSNANVEQEIEENPEFDSSNQPGAQMDDQAAPSAGQFVVRRVAGIAGRDFRRALAATRLPAPLVKEVLLAFKYDAGAPRVPPQNAGFSVIYEGVLQDGKFQEPQLRYATMNDGRKTHRVYRYQTDDATTAFIHANGQGIAFVDLDKPLRIDAKITSPYGWRIHPVFGDRRFHEGVDFGAPKGTPVVATADGRVDDIGWRGNYGEYVRLEHDSSLATAYAHLAGFARGLRKGSTVKRGQVIGYVGRTGVATGPHLYYEVIVAGKRVDPLKAPPVVSVSLTGTQLAEFQKFVERAPEE
ncbi:M23 family metallopeptidase [Dongia soli]|uniref:M23 family metallopeptidase n=1 Tax=Dongia soli TaxID=600628 RepID=A0ABU5E6N2_9PROT|nr:M23 family metallopeptidase [Dongia soli]MDY0881526.1 M23 family metallopeptidase [Dongia soli]